MSRRRILVVDDDRDIRESLKEVLGDDHDVEVAGTAAEAVGKVKSHARRCVRDLVDFAVTHNVPDASCAGLDQNCGRAGEL